MLGAVTAYAVIAAGGLQLADIVVHALNLPSWSLRALIWASAIGLPVTFAVSWFWDLTRHGFVRTVGPIERASPAVSPSPSRSPEALAALQAIGPGDVLGGRYRIERVLGIGGMGRVLAAEDLRLGRRVAVKIVTGAHDPARLRRFEQEARTAGSLEHPNVLGVYDLGEQDGVPFLVTELLEGHTLRTVIDQGPLPPDQAHGLALQLARGLAAAHASGVIHRDLKPENLFLTRDGRLKILDFGMAKLASPDALAGPGLTITGMLFGSPGYLSPEQARGEPAGPASDVFSAGAVLYELLTGRRAFPGASLVEAGHAAITLTPPPLPDPVPAGLAQTIFRALEKEPGRRFPNGAALVQALERVSGSAPAPIERVARRVNWRLSTSLMVLLAAVAIGGAITSAIFVRPHATTPPRPRDGFPESGVEAPSTFPQAPTELGPGAPAVPIPPLPGQIPGLDPQKFAQRMSRLPQMGALSGVMAGVNALEAAGKPAQAQKILEDYVRHRPDDLGAQLHLAAVRRRNGDRARADADLRTLAKSLRGDDWMQHLVRVWAGLVPESDAITAAHVRGDPETTRTRLTQTYYYLGLAHETAQPPDLRTARRDYQKALREAGAGPELDLAAQALDRMGEPVPSEER